MPGKFTRAFCLFPRIMEQECNLTYNAKFIDNFTQEERSIKTEYYQSRWNFTARDDETRSM